MKFQCQIHDGLHSDEHDGDISLAIRVCDNNPENDKGLSDANKTDSEDQKWDLKTNTCAKIGHGPCENSRERLIHLYICEYPIFVIQFFLLVIHYDWAVYPAILAHPEDHDPSRDSSLDACLLGFAFIFMIWVVGMLVTLDGLFYCCTRLSCC